ncbi:MAG: DUF4279 domain-containing protein [Propionibacteriales bacterium]|nr:DUF4279 domain-containing protein [Propionibacteriales bacterium]
MIKASFAIESRELTLDEISAAMAREPDRGFERGSVGPSSTWTRDWTSWSMELQLPRDIHAGTEGLTTAIASLGTPMAERAATLAAKGCEVVLSVHQELADRPEDTGLNLDSAAIRWLAAAGAVLSVDQYVATEPT